MIPRQAGRSPSPRTPGQRAQGSVLAALMLAACNVALAAGIPPGERRSDTVLLAPETRAMQEDDTANPGMLAVLDGEELWARPPAAGAPACAACHGDARLTMKGVAARHPAWSERAGRPVDLAARVNLCRTERQGAGALAPESRDLLALTGFVAHQSRGLPIAPPEDPRLAPARERGRTLFGRRMGQLDLACAQCHDDHWGRRLAGAAVPQAHPTGYPIYRLEWQAMGSLQRRLRGCLTGIRAEPFPPGAPEYVELELFLMERARGLAMETPAVRP